ncbi:hypothetical protein BLNAU_16184 [Blattamonas nauphoetae]|uniref:Uncharacterized protein n=1 Tax=Blattamonas nauphoetae TaxID=2049346 RepID=A0ABQ9XA90_9EUKA|nr:hypothetical protein BLNAU_16184 [Blattamonas nauphoetae]
MEAMYSKRRTSCGSALSGDCLKPRGNHGKLKMTGAPSHEGHSHEKGDEGTDRCWTRKSRIFRIATLAPTPPRPTLHRCSTTKPPDPLSQLQHPVVHVAVAVNSFMHLFDANTGKQNGEYDMGNIVTALVIEDRQRKLHFGTIDGEKRHSDTIASLEYIPLSHPILRARLIRAHLEADSSDALHSVGWRTHCQRATFTTITHLAPLEHLLPINLVPTKDNATQQPDQKHH